MKTVIKPVTARKNCTGKGRLATQLNMREMKSVFLARKSGMTFDAIERDPRFGLRHVNGMTAWRAVQKYMRMAGRRSCAGTTLRPLHAV